MNTPNSHHAIPDDDEPQTWRELAEAAIADLRGYADDELPYRRMVSAEAYEQRFALLDSQPQSPGVTDAMITAGRKACHWANVQLERDEFEAIYLAMREVEK